MNTKILKKVIIDNVFVLPPALKGAFKFNNRVIFFNLEFTF